MMLSLNQAEVTRAAAHLLPLRVEPAATSSSAWRVVYYPRIEEALESGRHDHPR